MPDKIERLSSMQEGLYCVLRVNNKISYRKVAEAEGKKYITHNKRRVYEQDLPIGEEVTIQ